MQKISKKEIKSLKAPTVEVPYGLEKVHTHRNDYVWGHSAILWKGNVVVFGGFMGRIRNVRKIKVMLYDVNKKKWLYPLLTGRLPPRKAGHSSTLVKGD